MIIGSSKLINKAKCYPSGTNSSLVMTHYTLGVQTCPTFPYLIYFLSSSLFNGHNER